MAQSQKMDPSPQTVTIPKALLPIVEAFSIESKDMAKALIQQAACAIYYKQADAYGFSDKAIPITKKEIDEVYTLMRAINPKDLIEALHGAQIIVGHLLGMRKLTQPNLEDQCLGLKLLRLSSDALERLERKRSGHQNINVTYHNNSSSIQTIVTQQMEG